MSTSIMQCARLTVLAGAVGACAAASAAQVKLTITAENLAPANSVSFAPLHYGVHSGVFDAFDIGQAAGSAITSVAEGGFGQPWLDAFAAADPTASVGVIGAPLFPGQSYSTTVMVDTAVNPYFTFAAMALPSNDFFIGNDSPLAFRILDNDGNLLVSSIGQKANQIWDNGSEVFDPTAAAFVGDIAQRADQNSVVALNFAELAAFNGLTTGAGYVFESGLTAQSDIYQLSFQVAAVPEPETFAMMATGLLVIGSVARRRQKARRA
jgi:hypothetical protein